MKRFSPSRRHRHPPLRRATRSATQHLKDVSPRLLEVFCIDGKTYGLPFDRNNMAMHYNTKMVRESGEACCEPASVSEPGQFLRWPPRGSAD
jgi:maltose-binding protein MalE